MELMLHTTIKWSEAPYRAPLLKRRRITVTARTGITAGNTGGGKTAHYMGGSRPAGDFVPLGSDTTPIFFFS